jgi:hypothetical protein
MQRCAAAVSLDPSLAAATECLLQARHGLQIERDARLQLRLSMISNLMQTGALSTAQSALDSLKSDEQRESAEAGPLPTNDQQAIDNLGLALAERQQQEWPASIPNVLGLREWLPGVVSLLLRILVFCLAALLLVWLAALIREGYRILRWRTLPNPIDWCVSSLADTTGQSAVGALMDALTVNFNPLFQPLPTSSLLASPPRLLAGIDSGDPASLVWRNFIITPSPTSPQVRHYLSDKIESVEVTSFAGHRFRQVEAFEDINLKLGILEGSLGALLRNLRRWWMKGWPSVTGSVGFEDINDKRFASVRLICNYGLGRKSSNRGIAPYDRDITPQEFFAEERTLSVFASTQTDESADAVALASQRAAFRLLYRLAKRPADPNLATAASSYRQGVRLLIVVL